ncbi:hypothetical protein RHGRI_031329 [Rhododendron griersonianum]|uniref:Uncharacterized protein n=1 Tax=Rhododendron griersonianum TaxID=479676 RepID=A0AAV6I7F0_9ERIC|nr:hypothetical protein RHGRI_031329 [Rhododendron griersonianum]
MSPEAHVEHELESSSSPPPLLDPSAFSTEEFQVPEFEQLFMVFGKARPAEPVDYNKRCPLCKIPVLLLKLNGKARMGAQQWSNAQDSLLGLENNNVASVVEGIDANQNLRAQFSSDMSSTLEDVDFASKKILSSIDHSLQLDHDACGNLDSMILPCCGELREPKGGHYHNIVEIMKNAGKCLLSEYAVRISKYHLNIGKKLLILLHTYWLWTGGSYNCLTWPIDFSKILYNLHTYCLPSAISDQQSVLKFGHLYLPALQLCSELELRLKQIFRIFDLEEMEVYFYAINTNAQALLQSAAKKPLQIGELFTRGLALVLSL